MRNNQQSSLGKNLVICFLDGLFLFIMLSFSLISVSFVNFMNKHAI